MERLEPTDIKIHSWESQSLVTQREVVRVDRLRVVLQDLCNNFFVNGNDQALSEIKERFGVLFKSDKLK